MDERPDLREFLSEVNNFTDETSASPAAVPGQSVARIGQVVEIAGSGSQARLDAARLAEISGHPDPSIATSGQVGSQVKLIVGNNWLIANVRRYAQPTTAHCRPSISWRGRRDAAGGSAISVAGKRIRSGGATSYRFDADLVRCPQPATAAYRNRHVYPTDDSRRSICVRCWPSIPCFGRRHRQTTSVARSATALAASPEATSGDRSARRIFGRVQNAREFQRRQFAAAYWLGNFEDIGMFRTTRARSPARAAMSSRMPDAARTKGKEMSQWQGHGRQPDPYL